jgi:anti-anti-sigma factor
VQVSASPQRDGGVVTVAVSGEVDLSTVRTVDRAIAEALSADGVTAVQVDLSGVEFLDSSGISALLKGRRGADERGLAYRVVGAHGIAERVLRMSGVWTHLTGGTGSP